MHLDRYIGLDVHSASCTAGVLSANGKRLSSTVLETNGKTLVEFLRLIPGDRHLIVEEGTHAARLHEIWSPHVKDMVVMSVSGGPRLNFHRANRASGGPDLNLHGANRKWERRILNLQSANRLSERSILNFSSKNRLWERRKALLHGANRKWERRILNLQSANRLSERSISNFSSKNRLWERRKALLHGANRKWERRILNLHCVKGVWGQSKKTPISEWMGKWRPAAWVKWRVLPPCFSQN